MRGHIKNALGLFAALCCGAMLCTMPVFAQEAQRPEETQLGWTFRWINFALVAALIIWGFSKAVPHFRSNAADISQKIAEGKRAREAAEKQRAEAKAKLAGIPQEVEAIRADAKRSTQLEGERLRALAKRDAEMIEHAGQEEIAATERASRMELKALAARLAIERAEAVLRRDLSDADEASLFRAFVAELTANGGVN
jgi:F-type H+-transporting ATPase subunit b